MGNSRPSKTCDISSPSLQDDRARGADPTRDLSRSDYWDSQYRNGASWDTGFPSMELIRVLQQGWVKPCTAIELGCGTGTNSAHLATMGFNVTAVDISICAIQQAVARTDASKVRVNFVWMDVLGDIGRLNSSFDFVLDCGCYHSLGCKIADQYLTCLRRITNPQSKFLLLAERPATRSAPGFDCQLPGQFFPVTEEAIRDFFESVFTIEWIRKFDFDARHGDVRRPGWSCLMTRK